MLALYILKIATVGPSSSMFSLQKWQLADALGKGVKQILGDISCTISSASEVVV